MAHRAQKMSLTKSEHPAQGSERSVLENNKPTSLPNPTHQPRPREGHCLSWPTRTFPQDTRSACVSWAQQSKDCFHLYLSGRTPPLNARLDKALSLGL